MLIIINLSPNILQDLSKLSAHTHTQELLKNIKYPKRNFTDEKFQF